MDGDVFDTAGFLAAREDHYANYSVSPELALDAGVLETLLRDGIYVEPEFVDRDTVRQIVADLEPPVRELWERGATEPYNATEPYKTYVDREFGVARLMRADELSAAATEAFFENQMIGSMARAFVAPDVSSYQRMIEYRGGPGLVSQADNWHFDDWRQRFKALLYLVDVDETACPFAYLPGTHELRDEPWRIRKEAEYHRFGKQGAYGYFMFHEIQNLCREHGWTPRVLTAPAGTLMLVDTRMLHRGTTSRGRDRLLLANYFDVREAKPGQTHVKPVR